MDADKTDFIEPQNIVSKFTYIHIIFTTKVVKRMRQRQRRPSLAISFIMPGDQLSNPG